MDLGSFNSHFTKGTENLTAISTLVAIKEFCMMTFFFILYYITENYTLNNYSTLPLLEMSHRFKC